MIQSILYLTAYLSINLGFINALPFPAFDGGRILFVIIEAITNRCEIEIEHKNLTLISESLHQVLRDNKLKFYEEEKAVCEKDYTPKARNR